MLARSVRCDVLHLAPASPNDRLRIEASAREPVVGCAPLGICSMIGFLANLDLKRPKSIEFVGLFQADHLFCLASHSVMRGLSVEARQDLFRIRGIPPEALSPILDFLSEAIGFRLSTIAELVASST